MKKVVTRGPNQEKSVVRFLIILFIVVIAVCIYAFYFVTSTLVSGTFEPNELGSLCFSLVLLAILLVACMFGVIFFAPCRLKGSQR